MKDLMMSVESLYKRLRRGLAGLEPVVLLLFRVWVALAFWRAGVVKLEDPFGTQFLFNVMYQVPLLSPDVAATLGTWIELIVPWFIVFGLLGRPFALFLFIYNIIAVTSFPDLWPNGFWTDFFNISSFADHKVWGLMLLAIVAWGPGTFSLDRLVRRFWPKASGPSEPIQTIN
ncbi:MAG: DoxX family protein [Rhodanobacter sp.]